MVPDMTSSPSVVTTTARRRCISVRNASFKNLKIYLNLVVLSWQRFGFTNGIRNFINISSLALTENDFCSCEPRQCTQKKSS